MFEKMIVQASGSRLSFLQKDLHTFLLSRNTLLAEHHQLIPCHDLESFQKKGLKNEFENNTTKIRSNFLAPVPGSKIFQEGEFIAKVFEMNDSALWKHVNERGIEVEVVSLQEIHNEVKSNLMVFEKFFGKDFILWM